MATLSTAYNTPDKPFAATGTISAANSARDGTGAVLVFSAQVNGAIVNRIHVHALAATTAGMIRFFTKPYGAGAIIALIHEMEVPAVTPGATVPAWSDNYIPSPFGLGSSGQILVTTENAEEFRVTVLGWQL